MKTLAVLAATPSGGHPRYVRSLLEPIRQLRPDVHVYWPVRPDVDPAVLSGSPWDHPAVIPPMPVQSLPRALVLASRLHPGLRHDYSFLRWLKTRGPVDTVLLEEWLTGGLHHLVSTAKQHSSRVVVHVHDAVPHDRGGVVRRLFMDTDVRRGLDAADEIVVHTPRIRRLLLEHYAIRTPVGIVPHGLRPRRGYADPPEQKRVLFYGVNRPNKGLDLLVEALEGLTDVQLVVAGRTERKRVDETAALLGRMPDTRWINAFVGQEETDRLFSEASLVALPYRDFEAQSGVLHQAIEYGVPVVVTNTGALAETVSELGLGAVVPSQDPESLRSAAAHLLRADVNARFRRNVVAAQSKRSWHASAESLLEILDRTAACASSR